MPKFRKKPVTIEAVEWNGDNFEEIIAFAAPTFVSRGSGNTLSVNTLEGPLAAQVGDWVVKGVKGEFYPVKPDVFAATYDSVE